MLRLFLLLSLLIANLFANDFLIEISDGLIQGHVVETEAGHKFLAYEGIPYAQAPIGKNRFSEPKRIKPWKGVWKADQLHICLQYDHFSAGVIGNEDCLYLNVYVPMKKPETLLDVIVSIHGGAFMFGQGHRYGPYSLLNRDDVIFVNFNYRLGIFGFLSTEDEVLPGNMGMKDQVFALQWVQRNIDSFGGNPNSVTITGLSAGGASVHLHYLSPLSRGLFKQGLSQSGSALNPWVICENLRDKTKIVADKVGCPTGSSNAIVDCLKTRSAMQLIDKTKLFMHWLYNPVSPFGVTIEPKSEHAFLSEHPYKLMERGNIYDVPWVISFTEREGLYPAAEFVSQPTYLETLEDNWNEYAPHILDFNNTLDKNYHKLISKLIKDYYLGNEAISENTFDELVCMVGDRLFVNDILKAAKLHNDNVKSPVYMYYFTYRGQCSKSDDLSKMNRNYGVSHGDDLIYILFNSTIRKNTDELKMTELFINFWVSFAKYSRPEFNHTDWSPISKKRTELEYLLIGSPNNISMQKIDPNGIMTFWNSLSFKENENLV